MQQNRSGKFVIRKVGTEIKKLRAEQVNIAVNNKKLQIKYEKKFINNIFDSNCAAVLCNQRLLVPINDDATLVSCTGHAREEEGIRAWKVLQIDQGGFNIIIDDNNNKYIKKKDQTTKRIWT